MSTHVDLDEYEPASLHMPGVRHALEIGKERGGEERKRRLEAQAAGRREV